MQTGIQIIWGGHVLLLKKSTLISITGTFKTTEEKPEEALLWQSSRERRCSAAAGVCHL
jgi:hypothetical protein